MHYLEQQENLFLVVLKVWNSDTEKKVDVSDLQLQCCGMQEGTIEV